VWEASSPRRKGVGRLCSLRIGKGAAFLRLAGKKGRKKRFNLVGRGKNFSYFGKKEIFQRTRSPVPSPVKKETGAGTDSKRKRTGNIFAQYSLKGGKKGRIDRDILINIT